MSKFDIVQHNLERTNASFEDLNEDYRTYVEALRDGKWAEAEILQNQIRATTEILLRSMFAGFALASAITDDNGKLK